ncbi:MAG: DUF6279 family lipoprotein [Marinobacter sp.]|nr:DUF6279 family lipoprotein [Marinobacter sp.]
MRALHKHLIWLVILALLAGCNSNRLGYRFADWGVRWWVNDYVDLTREQRRTLSSALSSHLAWHCAEELPRYGDWLAEVDHQLRNDLLTPDAIAGHQQTVIEALERLALHIAPTASTLLASLSDTQVDNLAQAMADNQRRREGEFLDDDDPAKEHQARAKRTAERMERWFGSLSPAQGQIIADWNDRQYGQTRIWLQGRERWQRALLDALQTRDQADFPARVEALLLDGDRFRGEEYEAMTASSRAAMIHLIADLLAEASPQQRSHLSAELDKLRRDARALSC